MTYLRFYRTSIFFIFLLSGLHVIMSRVFDRDVGTIKRIEIRAKRTFGYFASEWTLEKVL